MSILSYSLTNLSPEHQPPHQHLRYVTSSSFGTDWNGVLHSHDCTELFYVTDGEGWLCTDETQIPLQKNTLVIVNPKVHHTERSSQEKKMHYIVLGIDNLQFRFHEGETFSPFQIFQLTSHREMILSLLHAILEELQKNRPPMRKSASIICPSCSCSSTGSPGKNSPLRHQPISPMNVSAPKPTSKNTSGNR